jgi:hypothetical protein
MNEWNEESKDTLKLMWADGIHAKEIGVTVGRTKNSVLGMANRLGLPKHPWSLREKKGRQPRKPVTKVKVEIKPPMDVPPITFTSSGVSFMKVGTYECHAVIGRDDDRYSLVRYCGLPVHEGQSWCPHHCRQYLNYRV